MRPVAELDLPLQLHRDEPTPLHAQLAAGLRTAAATGLLPAGVRLPPSRLLAARLGVARSTVVAAYEELAGEGLVEARHGSGTFVGSLPPAGRRPAEGRAAAGPSSTGEDLVDLRPGRPSTARLTDAAWMRAWRVAARRVRTAEPPAAGLAELRQAIAIHLGAARGLQVAADDVLVTAGTVEALSLVAHALDLTGRVVAMEEPGFSTGRRALTRLGCDVLPVPVDADGLCVDLLPREGRTPAAVFTTPSHQYPLGARMSVERRLALLAWAEAVGAVVVEDDYDSEFRFDVAPLPALAGLDRAGRVVHVGTFSKVLTPWLRAGYVAVPPRLAGAFSAVRHDLGCPVGGVEQEALAEYLSSGALRRHIARSRRDYAHRRAHLARSLERHAGTLGLGGIDAGLHAVVTLPTGTDPAAVVRQLRRNGFLVEDVADACVDPAPDRVPAVILGYAEATLAELDRAVELLAEAAVAGRT
ncbi:GntR family transcriptional regulator/MocR family aminotransferase [Kineococcus xinjiangensis]|uniref:GntR family transcriptional regulator/MocR family aminotransferase n=1 Tax=Kineococcus xinjiangensis TaxID=512762 RepID=A0A2S6IEI9_9ACTN|nr:PLP-dependent aminotransferase family protein [Kineococcus xinjiangensis]PPK92619.1 GntR family transcriptional regulator/MocR family aminotransferase [Kineococcus xinjiangensis]